VVSKFYGPSHLFTLPPRWFIPLIPSLVCLLSLSTEGTFPFDFPPSFPSRRVMATESGGCLVLWSFFFFASTSFPQGSQGELSPGFLLFFPLFCKSHGFSPSLVTVFPQSQSCLRRRLSPFHSSPPSALNVLPLPAFEKFSSDFGPFAHIRHVRRR